MISGVRVLDRTTEIAGPYCAKLLADAGADVVRIEPLDGDPIVRYRSGALFEYLNASKRVLTNALEDAVMGADLVVTNSPEEAGLIRRDRPGLIVVCITPFGMDGPWAARPATEFTLQAACGSIGSRGDPDGPPVAAGGRIGEWITGTYAAVGAIAAIGVAGPPCFGRLIDVAMLDCMAVTLVTHPSVWASFAGWPPMAGTGRTIEVPSVEPTEDGFAVFTTNSRQQFQDFLVMIGRADWLEDAGLARVAQRFARRHEFLEPVHQYTRGRSTAAVLEDAGLFRIPAGPVLNGSTVPLFEQFASRGVFVRSPSGRFRQPVPPYRIGGVTRPELRTSTGSPTDNGKVGWNPRSADAEPHSEDRRLPLTGIRVLDCTGWWAGPSTTHVLACLGADVVKVESLRRPDPMRTASSRPAKDPDWLEWSPIYHAANFSKRAVTLDLTRPEAVRVFERLAARADVVVENYMPRVME
jgi:crotonobetainyl-CoA:carnitine CoA-transferase CaiB-like acyl-CoA transferase